LPYLNQSETPKRPDKPKMLSLVKLKPFKRRKKAAADHFDV
jgi:hypothetical protein